MSLRRTVHPARDVAGLTVPIDSVELPDWLVRELLPIVLRLIGREDAAAAVAALPRIRPSQVLGGSYLKGYLPVIDPLCRSVTAESVAAWNNRVDVDAWGVDGISPNFMDEAMPEVARAAREAWTVTAPSRVGHVAYQTAVDCVRVAALRPGGGAELEAAALEAAASLVKRASPSRDE